MSSFLGAVGLAPSLTPPTTPAPAPATFVWAVLAFVRREVEQQLQQLQRTFLNRTPIAATDTLSLTEDVITGNIVPLTNDRDPDGSDTLRVVKVTPPPDADGTLTINPDGTTLTYTQGAKAQALGAGQTLTETYTYTVSDAASAPHVHGLLGLLTGGGHTATQRITITVTGVNDSPDAEDDTVTVDEDAPATTIAVLSNDTDPDTNPTPDTLSVTAVDSTGLRYGTAALSATGVVTYTPDDRADAIAAGSTETDRFTYTVSDGHGGTATAEVTVTITGADDAPTITPDHLVIDENAGTQRIDVLANVIDVDGGPFTITAVTQGSEGLGIVAIDDDVVTYTPSAAALALGPGEQKTETFTYTVSAGDGDSVTGTITVTIRGVADNVVVSTGTATPVEIELGPDGDFGLIRNADGTLTSVDYDDDDGWVVGATYGDIDADAFDLDGQLAYAYSNQDGSLRLLDRDTGVEIDRARDVRTGLTYRFDDVTDVAVDHRVGDDVQVETAYVIERDGTLSEIDTRTGTVVRSVETGGELGETLRAASAVAASPKLAVAPGSGTVYVASGNRIAVVKTRSADELVYDASLDRSLEGEVTALQASRDGTKLYATVASVDASGRAVSRLVAMDVSAEDGALTELNRVELGSGARSLAINDDLNRAYVVGDTDVSVVGLGDLDVIRRVDIGATAGVVAVSAERDAVLVTNPDAHAVSVVTDAPITIELDWGLAPRDLDGHLFGPGLHVSYLDPTHEVTSGGMQEIGAFLNVDDTDGEGPEIIQIDTRTPGVYHYYVVNFSGETDFGGPTTVSIRDPRSGIEETFELPTAGSGRYWTVFTLTVSDDGSATLTSVNTLSNEKPEPGIPTPPGAIDPSIL